MCECVADDGEFDNTKRAKKGERYFYLFDLRDDSTSGFSLIVLRVYANLPKKKHQHLIHMSHAHVLLYAKTHIYTNAPRITKQTSNILYVPRSFFSASSGGE